MAGTKTYRITKEEMDTFRDLLREKVTSLAVSIDSYSLGRAATFQADRLQALRASLSKRKAET